MKNRTTLTINKISQRFGAQRHRMMRCALQQIIVQSLHFQAKQNGILSKNPPLGKPLPPTKYFPLSPRIVARATMKNGKEKEWRSHQSGNSAIPAIQWVKT